MSVLTLKIVPVDVKLTVPMIADPDADYDADEKYDTESRSVQSYARKRNTNRKNEKSIEKDMQHMSFPEDIKSRANAIHIKLGQRIRRINRRALMIFYCVYNAYIEMKINIDPKQIAKEVGIRPSDINSAMSMFSEAQTGYKPIIVYSSPLDFIPDYARGMGISEEYIPDILQSSKEILELSPELSEKYPQTTGAGLLYYWMFCRGISATEAKQREVFNLSPATIRTITRDISTIHNGEIK